MRATTLRVRYLAASLLLLSAMEPGIARAQAQLRAQPQAQPLPEAQPLAAIDPPPPPEGRLPDAVIPTAYRLDLTLDPAQPRFAGHVEIDAVMRGASRFVYLHGRDLAVSRATATFAGRAIAANWRQVDPSGLVLLTFPVALPAGPVTFAFDYDAPFQDGPEGLFHVKVGDRWYGWSQFESNDARAAYPGFDQPGYKQPFTLTMRTPAGLTAVSNAPETGIEHQGGTDIHHFAATAPLPTYLLAVMVGPFAFAQSLIPATPQRAAALPLRIVSTPENAAHLTFALENTKPIVVALETYFGQSFPYPKLDEITTPILPGAMENAGADLFEDPLIVLDDDASTARKREFGMTVAHELSHQWFGDLVTPVWWDDVWLNESFANWMGYRIGNIWRPDLHIAAGGLAEGFAAMDTDALLAGRPIRQRIGRTAEIDAAFDSITYGKGAQVVAMIAAYMGDDRFREGVRRYMAMHRYGNATSADFFAALAEVAGDPRIVEAMRGFADQQGVPLITFTPAPGAQGGFLVTQSRYARLGTAAPDTRWIVPLCLRVGDTRQCRLLDRTAAIIAAPPDALVMPNAGGDGYDRFELPPAQWDRLIAASDQLPAGEALALADSLLASFQAGHASASQLAELARVMSGNADSRAAAAAVGPLAWLAGYGLLDDAALDAYRGFIGRLYAPQLASYGFDPRAGAYASEDPERSQRRVDVVGMMVRTGLDDQLRRRLRDAARAWLAGDTGALDPVWYPQAFAVWLGGGGRREAQALLDRALASQDPQFRPAALGALAGSGQTRIAQWLLDGVRDPRLRLSERMDLVTGVASARGTREFGYDWMRNHLAELVAGRVGIFLSAHVAEALGLYCSASRADDIERDFGPSLAGRTSQLELERAVEMVRDCDRLRIARGAEASAQIANLR